VGTIGMWAKFGWRVKALTLLP